MLTEILQRLTLAAGKLQFFTNPYVGNFAQNIRNSFNLIKRNIALTAVRELNLQFTIQDLYVDLYNMWLDGRHDGYLSGTFKEFIADGLGRRDALGKNTSYLFHFQLIPNKFLQEILQMPDPNKSPVNNIVHTQATAKKQRTLLGNFEKKLKLNPSFIKYVGESITLNSQDKALVSKTSGRQDFHVSIDQQSERLKLTKLVTNSPTVFQPGITAEAFVDPGADITSLRGSRNLANAILTESGYLNSALFCNFPKVNFYCGGEFMYSFQLAPKTNLDKFSLAREDLLKYTLRIPARDGHNAGTFQINTGGSAGQARKTEKKVGRGATATVQVISEEDQASSKIGKLFGDRGQALSILAHHAVGDYSVILGTGDAALLNQYKFLHTVVKKSVNPNILFYFLFDYSIDYSQQNKMSIKFFCPDPSKFEVTSISPRILSGEAVYSRRSNLQKALLKNLFNTNLNNNSYKNRNVYRNTLITNTPPRNVVQSIRGAMRSIQPPLKSKLNNIFKKSNCNANGDPYFAPRRSAKKQLTNALLNIIVRKLQNPNYTPNSARNYREPILRFLGGLPNRRNPPIPLESNERMNLCSGNMRRITIGREKVKQRYGAMPSASNATSGSQGPRNNASNMENNASSSPLRGTLPTRSQYYGSRRNSGRFNFVNNRNVVTAGNNNSPASRSQSAPAPAGMKKRKKKSKSRKNNNNNNN